MGTRVTPDAGTAGLPLEGIRVVDCTQVAAGPYASTLLGDLGADVVKVELPEGEPFREIDDVFGVGESGYYYGINRSKRSLALDLKSEAGRAVLDRLVADADVFAVAFRPAVTRRLGLTYDRLSGLNERLVYCSLTAFGETGPRAEEPGMDLLAQALSGVISLTGEPDGPPVKAGPPISDYLTGMLLAVGVLAALRARDRDGRGDRVEVDLLSSLMAGLGGPIVEHLATGVDPGRRGTAHPTLTPCRRFETADGSLVIACLEEGHWPGLCRAVGRPQWVQDARFATNAARLEHRDPLVTELASRLAEQPCDHWLERLDREGVPCAPVNDLRAALAEPQATANGLLGVLEHPTAGPYHVIDHPVGHRRTRPRARGHAPRLGEHTREVLLEAGLSTAEIAALEQEGVAVQSGRREPS